MFTLNALVEWRSQQHPDAVALIDDRGDRATYRELEERSLRCARRWMDRGVSQGDVVALLDTNSVVGLVNLFGLGRIGAIPALMNWRLTVAENSALLEQLEPAAVVAGSALVDRLPADLPPLRILIDRTSVTEEVEGWAADADSGASVPTRADLPEAPMPSDICALAFSSGTTGRPKGIPWRHEALARSTMVDGFDVAGMGPGAPNLAAAPNFHLAGLSNCLMSLARGSEIHLRTGFDAHQMLHDIEELRIQYVTVVPAMFRALVQAARTRRHPPDTSSMLEMSYGASPISPDLVREVQALFPTAGLRQFYGMTEIGGALTSLTPADHHVAAHAESAGRVNPGFDVKLVDPTGEVVPDGAPGQILVRSASLMYGYWDDPKATAEVMVDGWFATGDIAIRKDGYLTVMDRSKDMVVSGGENVYPAEVEAAIDRHSEVLDVAVIGVPDEKLGERVHAVLVLTADSTLTLDQLQAFCRANLAGYKVPRSMERAEVLPRNATGKILKRDLRAPHWEGADRAV